MLSARIINGSVRVERSKLWFNRHMSYFFNRHSINFIALVMVLMTFSLGIFCSSEAYSAQNSELFGYSYQICYQYSTPYDSTFTILNHINIDIVSVNNDTIYSFEDNFANGPFGSCTFIADTLVVDSIYRMYLTSDDWNCFGDIQFQ